MVAAVELVPTPAITGTFTADFIIVSNFIFSSDVTVGDSPVVPFITSAVVPCSTKCFANSTALS